MRELNFKPGDWVTSNHSKIPIKSDKYTISQHNTNPGFYDFKKWEPVEGEWCWCWNIHMDKPVLCMVEELLEDGFYRTSPDNGQIFWEYCEPFIGELPILIKKLKGIENA